MKKTDKYFKFKNYATKILKNIKENALYIVLYITLIIISLLLARVINEPQLGEFIKLKEYDFGKVARMITVVPSLVYFFLFINIDKEKNINISKIFLFVSIPIGILYMIFLPINSIPDEDHHFYRAYEVSLGHLVSDINEKDVGGNFLSSNLDKIHIKDSNTYQEWIDQVKENELTEETVFYNFANTSLYSFVCYIPQALGIAIVRIFTSNPLIQAYGGRIMNFAAFITIMYFSIKKIPLKKLTILIVASLPMVFQEAISLSIDGTTIAVATLIISYILYLKYEKQDKINKIDYIILFTSSLILALSKIVYIPICLLLYAIPENLFKNKKDKFIKISIIVSVVIILNLIWLSIASGYLMEFNKGVNSLEQVKSILKYPINYLMVIINTLNIKNISGYIFEILGNSLGYLNIRTSTIFQIPLFVLLGFVLICENYKKIIIDKKIRIMLLTTVLMVAGLIFTSLYVQWTPVGKTSIDGIQGRYFIPIIPLIGILLYNNIVIIDKKMPYRYILLFMIFVNLHALICIINNYMW